MLALMVAVCLNVSLSGCFGKAYIRYAPNDMITLADNTVVHDQPEVKQPSPTLVTRNKEDHSVEHPPLLGPSMGDGNQRWNR